MFNPLHSANAPLFLLRAYCPPLTLATCIAGLLYLMPTFSIINISSLKSSERSYNITAVYTLEAQMCDSTNHYLVGKLHESSKMMPARTIFLSLLCCHAPLNFTRVAEMAECVCFGVEAGDWPHKNSHTHFLCYTKPHPS